MILPSNNKANNNQKNSQDIKNSISVDKITTSKKLNISIMDKKLSLLNSNIEDLYKKYLEKKRIRRNHEKNEQSLVNHINFLIDEERKIRTQIENKSLKSSKIKKKSIRIFNSPEVEVDTSAIRYKTIESNDDAQRSSKNRTKKISRKKEKINQKIFRCINRNNEVQNDNSIKDITNDNNNISLSSFNNSIIENMRNISNDNTNKIENKQDINIIPKSNITNNVCIIINNPEKNTSKENSSIKNELDEISFAKNNNNDSFIKIANSEKNDYGSNINISTNENEKKRRDLEIQKIKLKLSSKLKENQNVYTQNSQTYEPHKEFIFNRYYNENINTPSFSQNKRLRKAKGNKNGVQSLKNILKMKRKYLSNLNREIDLKTINLNLRRKSVENRNINLIKNNNNQNKEYENFTFKKNEDKSSKYEEIKEERNTKKRSYSRPDRIINKTNKTNNNIKDEQNLGIDSNEVILTDSLYNSNNNDESTEINNKNNYNINTSNKKPIVKMDKINNESCPNIISLSNLTFNQSIEKKRKLLGIGCNIKQDIKKNNHKMVKKEIKLTINKDKNKNKDKKYEANIDDKTSYDRSSHTSFSNATNQLKNNIENNFSLASIFSSISYRTNIPTKMQKNNKNKNVKKINHEKPQHKPNNNNAHLTKIKNIYNDEIIIKKQEKNKLYLNSIRIIKKREKNNLKENNNPIYDESITSNKINNNINNNKIKISNTNNNKGTEKKIPEKKVKLYDNEITVQKGLAAIRRINKKIEEYKNSKPQIKMISQRRKNRFLEENKIDNDSVNNSMNISVNNNITTNRGKKYRFKSYRRLSEIQKQSNLFSLKNNINNQRSRSKSNKSMKKLQNNIKLLKLN